MQKDLMDKQQHKQYLKVLSMAERCIENRKYEKSIEYYKKVLAIRPLDSFAYSNIGYAFSNLKEHNIAIEYCDKAIAISPDVVCYQNKGYSLAQLGRHEEAILAYDNALKCQPDHFCTYYNKGNSFLYALGRYKEAIEAYDKAISLDPLLIVIISITKKC